jgi:hypothetical protein
MTQQFHDGQDVEVYHRARWRNGKIIRRSKPRPNQWLVQIYEQDIFSAGDIRVPEKRGYLEEGPHRPQGANADEWHLFLCGYLDNRASFPRGLTYVAVQIAEAIDEAEARGFALGWRRSS